MQPYDNRKPGEPCRMSDLDLTIARDGKNSQIFQLYAAQRHEECIDVIEHVLADSGGAAA